MTWTPEERREYSRRYYQEHRDEILTKNKSRRAANPERTAEQAHRYYTSRRETRIAQVMENRARDPDRHRDYQNEYNRTRHLERLREVAAEIGIPGVIVILCPRCGHIWRYRGTKPVAVCAICGQFINLRHGVGILREFPF